MSKLFRIDCGFQNYDWGKIGSSSAVAQFAAKSNPNTKIDESKPYAELWMGTHPSVPSKVVDDETLSGKVLRDVVSSDATTYLHPSVVEKFGSDKELPFLFKVLSIEKVLSIQAHPDKALAKQLHASDPKNYPDDNHKPEMAIAVTDFEGFCGFKPLDQIAATLKAVPELYEIVGDKIAQEFISGIKSDVEVGSEEDKHNRKLLQKVFGALMNTDDKTIEEKATSLVHKAETNPEVFDQLAPNLAKLILRLNKQFPKDIGLFCGCLLLNHVLLNVGEAMFLQAKDPHAYISGDIIECMAASDNVVRAGFTPKFKDVKNLVDMLTYSYESVEKQKMPLLPFDRSRGDAVKSVLYDPPIAEFAVLQTIFDKKAGQKQVFDEFNGPSVVIATNGNGTIRIQGGEVAMPAIAKEKIKSIIPFSVDGEEDLRLALQKHKGPFLFLKKDGELFAYALLNHQLLEKLKKGNFSKETLLRHAKPLDGISRLDDHISITSLFQIIGEPFALVRSEDGRPSGYIQREDMLAELFKQENESAHFLKILLASIPMGIFVLNREKRIIHCNEAGLRMIKLPHEAVLNAPGKSIFSHDHIAKAFETGKTYLNHLEFANGVGVLADYSPIQNFAGEVEGLIIVVQDLPMVEEMALEIEYIKDLNKDLNAILSTIYDEILVVNAKGELLRYGENIIEDFWQVDVKTLIGKNILDFEDQGLFTPSVIRLVMEKRKKVSVVQETRTGRKILAVGNPVFNEKGALDRIIIASRDITETTRLKTELKEMKEISARYKKELDQFKNKDRFLKKLIYCSPKMEKIMHQVKKIAEFSSTVLLSGESGVGKEVIAQAIYQFGKRSEKPFLKLNCGAIPETLLESELFGYVKGAFTGAEKNGKEGYFKQADGGILFLDEIGELPVHLQVKLLRVLQEQEVIPIGSTTPIKIDVQIIAATNQNLAKMVEEGRFREDLYYRLNVIPIRIPPLRERPEDISLLAFHFLQQLNEKYGRKFYLTPDAINVLECYPWPGNVRELQNIIERLVVTADHAAIDGGFVSQFLTFGSERKKMKPVVTRIMPLQEAMESVEEQLILQAMNQYKTTTKAAKALGISQSSVSRKYQKILNKKNRKTEDPVFK